MVYAMLMEATDAPDPSSFRNSDLYRRCVAAGVVPAGISDLNRFDQEDDGEDPSGAEDSTDNQLLGMQWSVDGMWCPACAWVIEAALRRLGGVHEAVCDFATDRLRCRYDPTRSDPNVIKRAVRALGYGLTHADTPAKAGFWRKALVRLMISAFLSVNVMMLSWALYSGFFTSLSPRDIRNISWPILIMTTAVMVYGGGPLFRKAWWGLRARAPGMETLVCLGAASAYVYSLYNFLSHSFHLYFDTASMLITLVLLGKLFETRAKAQVRRDLEGLMSFQPRKARRCSPEFPEGRFVALEQLAPQDTFRVIAGELVPADGEILSGKGYVDAAAITGESRPQSVSPGRSITSGMRLLKGDVTVSASRVGPESLLGQMVAVMEHSLVRRTPLESRTDRWLSLFVPLMMALAAATAVTTHALGLAWDQAFVRGLTVLVVACPCALGIAIPLARIAGISLAARRGILVRDFEAFEQVRHIDCAVLDKTGTLTNGRWSLDSVMAQDGLSKDQALALAAGLEKGSEHVIARSVRDYAARQGIQPARVSDLEMKANGVRGRYQGMTVKIGARRFAAPDVRYSHIDAKVSGPHSAVYLSLDGRLCATLVFGDQVRDGAAPLVSTLGRAGVECHLISGDAHAATQAVARQVGIPVDNAHGSQLPQEKVDFVARMQARGRHVVMVGDGINDAPALTRANLSVAVLHDASLAQQAAAVTLMRKDPRQLIDYMSLARKVNTTVVQNLGCAWIYNLISIPVAMSGLLNPLVAVTAMLLSSLTVIGNTLLLVRQRHAPGEYVTFGRRP